MSSVVVLLLMFFLCFAFSCKSAAYLIEGFYETGERDTIEEIDEDNLDYNYDKYRLKVGEKLAKPLTYTLSYSQEKRDYVTATLDNEYRQIKNKLEYLDENKKEKRQVTFDLDYKTKDYEEQSTDSYDRLGGKIKVAYKNKGSHLVRIEGGFDNFRYREAPSRNEEIVNTKLEAEKYIGDVTLRGYSRLAHSTDALFGTQTTNKLGISHKPGWSYLDLVRIDYTIGYRNSRQEEGEFDNDYRFSRINAYTRHPLGEKLGTVLKYEGVRKEYVTGNYDHTGFEVENDWKYSPLPGFYGKLGLIYRERMYETVKSLSHYKHGAEIALGYRKRAGLAWELSLGGESYRFPSAAAKDQDNKKIRLTLEKYALKHLKLEFTCQYRIKDYQTGNDVNYYLWRIGMRGLFAND